MDVEVLDAEMTVDESLIDAPVGEIRTQVGEYLQGERREFDLALAIPDGFTGEVMREMQAIPYGETRTYGELATRLDTAPVAVGGACGRNPIPLIVPCHRVVGSDSLGGFSTDCDDPLALKRRLLNTEREHATPEPSADDSERGGPTTRSDADDNAPLPGNGKRYDRTPTDD